jgi:hypothetical protein
MAAQLNAGSRYGWRGDARVVPAYALTQGRTRSAGNELHLETLVTATEFAGRYTAALHMESQAIVAMSGRPISVAEIGALLHLPIGVARVLVSDLAHAGYLRVSAPIPVDVNGRPSLEILERLLDGLRAC